MNRLVSFFQNNWIRFIVAGCIGITFFLIYLAVNSYVSSWTSIFFYCNAAFVAGFVLFGVSILALLSNLGGFDVFSFLFLRKRVDEHRKENFYEYCERKGEQHKKARLIFIPYLLISILFFILTAILYLIMVL